MRHYFRGGAALGEQADAAPNFVTVSPHLGGMAAARVFVDDLMVEVAVARARAAQGVGFGEGARAPASLARRPVHLAELTEEIGDGKTRRLTPLGYKTAVALPRSLAVLPIADHRREAARRYAHLVDVVGSAPAGELVQVRVDGGGRISDGGAAWRADLARELRDLRAALRGVALARGNARGNRSDVTVRALVDGVVLGGQEIKGVLKAHGWAASGRGGLYVRTVTDALHDALSRMADVGERY